MSKCQKCDGCGQVANSESQEPWTTWASLPPGTDIAVRLGIVQPIDCPVCGGLGDKERVKVNVPQKFLLNPAPTVLTPAQLDALDAVQDPEGIALVQAIHERKGQTP